MEKRQNIIHRCGFIEWKPESINAMDMSPVGAHPMLALIRANGDLELFDTTQNWHRQVIPVGGATGRGLESVLWLPPASMPIHKGEGQHKVEEAEVGTYSLSFGCMSQDNLNRLPTGRLFASGQDGCLIEWDVERLLPARHATIVGGGIWTMIASPDGNHLALACEDGHIRVVKVSTFQVILTLPHHDAKCLSLSWKDDLIAGGTSDGLILIWSLNLPAKQATLSHKINVDLLTKKGVIIWSCRFIPGNSKYLVSASSMGLVQFWDTKMGTLVHGHKLHKGDAMALAMGRGGERVFSSGVDALTVTLAGNGAIGKSWKPVERRTNHSRDIRTSVCAMIPVQIKGGFRYREVVLTGGVDGNLVIYDPEGVRYKETRTISPFPCQSLIKVAPEERLLLATLPDHLELYHLAQAAPKGTELGPETVQRLSMQKLGRNILRMNIPHGEHVLGCDVAPNGKHLAYSTRTALRLYSIGLIKDEGDALPKDVEISKLKIDEEESKGKVARMISFSPNSQMIAISYLSVSEFESSSVAIFSLSTDADAKVIKKLYEVVLPFNYPVDFIKWYSKNEIVVHQVNNAVSLLQIETRNQLQMRVKLQVAPPPKYISTIVSTGAQLVMMAVDGTTYIADPIVGSSSAKKPNKNIESSPAEIVAKEVHAVPATAHPIMGLLSASAGDRILFYTRDGISKLNLTSVKEDPIVKRSERKRKPASNVDNAKGSAAERISGYSNLLGVAPLSNDELVVVEVSSITIEEALPKAVKRRRFGRN